MREDVVAADVRRRKLIESRNPPPHVGGYDSWIGRNTIHGDFYQGPLSSLTTIHMLETESKLAVETKVSFPSGLHHAFLFSTFNALSYQIVLSSPMVLYAKTLQASATVLGIIAGMMPLLVIFQIPAANYIPRVGFKRFVYAG